VAGLTEFADRVVVVTGGASGIGRGVAEEFLAEGARVVIADRDAEALAATAAEIGATGIRTDVTDAASVQALADAVRERFDRIDVVCNNAGVGPKAPAAQLTVEDWSWVIDVNLRGVIHGVTAFLPHLLANPEGGWIVNTASMSVYFAPVGYAPYVASKAGVTGLSEVLRAELDGTGVGVTVLHPGAVATNIKNSLRNRPSSLEARSGLFDFDIRQKLPPTARWAQPRDAGRTVVRAVRDGELYAFTHPEMIDQVRAHFAAVEDAMRRAGEARAADAVSAS